MQLKEHPHQKTTQLFENLAKS